MAIVIQTIEQASPLLTDVKQLGKKNATTLGFFPEGAFDDYADKGMILVAINDQSKLAGYLLYRITKRIARITHLCVDENARGQGVSRCLIDELKKITADLIGISLKCRHDYPANNVWPRFHFIAMGQTHGRGNEPKTLIHWWFDHGHPTLLDHADLDTERKLRAVIDANVLFDLFDPSRDGYQESKFLQAPWVSDLLELRVCGETLNEINRNPDNIERQRSLEHALTITPLHSDPLDLERAYIKINQYHHKPSHTRTNQDESDLRQLAGTLAANVSYFVTRDDVLLRPHFVNVFSERFGLFILRPADFVRRIDQIQNGELYEPARLGGTAIQIAPAASGYEARLSELFHQLEHTPDFRESLRDLQADVGKCSLSVVSNSPDTLLAVIGVRQESADRLQVPILRVTRGKLSHTLSAHLILHLVYESIRRGCSAIEIRDLYLSDEIAGLLIDEGFVECDVGHFVKFHLPFLSSLSNLNSLLSELRSVSKEEESLIDSARALDRISRHQIPPSVFGDIENTFFPLKIIDSALPTFLVPIKPDWAKELFDVDLARQGLFAPDEALALRKEQAYFRSARNSARITAPARILWYVSKGSSRGYTDVGAIRACSFLVDVETGTPKDLFKKFERLGIYTWDDVRSINLGDLKEHIMVLLFGNTETFTVPVDLEQLNDLKVRFEWKMQLAGISRIPSQLFAEIYSRGQNRPYDPSI